MKPQATSVVCAVAVIFLIQMRNEKDSRYVQGQLECPAKLPKLIGGDWLVSNRTCALQLCQLRTSRNQTTVKLERNSEALSRSKKSTILQRSKDTVSRMGQQQSAPLAWPATMPLVDHYQELGLGYKASRRDINLAFKRLALKHHPDKSSPATREADMDKFHKVSNLSNTVNLTLLTSGYLRSRTPETFF